MIYVNNRIEPTVELLDKEWATIYDLCNNLDEREWALPTDCPEWTVKDQISHIIGTELMLSGEQPPRSPWQPEADDSAGSQKHEEKISQDENINKRFPYVKNPIGEANELWVDARRRTPPRQVLEEFHRITTERLAVLRSMSEEELAKVGWTPAGQAPYREFMAIRVFDCWVHEQDIRRAVNRPGNLAGSAAGHSRGRIKQAMPFVVGKKVQPPNGSIVVFHITNLGEADDTFAVEVNNGRAAFVDTTSMNYIDKAPVDLPDAGSSTAHLDMDFETFACLACGRWNPDESIQQGRASMTGNIELGTQVLQHLNFMI